MLKVNICFVGAFFGKRNTVYPGSRVFIYCSVVIPKNVYAVVIWLTGLIFVELPACGVYTLEVLKRLFDFLGV